MHLDFSKKRNTSKKESKLRNFINFLWIFRRSLIYQTKEFFENSTLHGVRYIAESGRPTRDKLMWFCFTTSGAVAALVIIMSLWEKFQTNPTITGLDTDFNDEDIVFPTVGFCPKKPFNHKNAFQTAYNYFADFDTDNATIMAPFLEMLTTLSFDNLMEVEKMSNSIPAKVLRQKTLREWAFEVQIKCEDTFVECRFRGKIVDCCSNFHLVYTEHGFCFAFNSRYKSIANADIRADERHLLKKVDKKWGLTFIPNETVGAAKLFLFDRDEYFGFDFKSQIDWEAGQHVDLRIGKKHTYTTDDARQLSIAQRKCIFFDEVKLKYFNEEYTFSSCMKECRIRNAIKFCRCIPPFYKPVLNIPMCQVHQFSCLSKWKNNITKLIECPHCELGCAKTVFNIEKLSKSFEATDEFSVLVELLSWPIIQYKREVLFGWVDLLVSFGGIASLFLGFSLLSGVEIIFYFTLRAFCMVYQNWEQLDEMEKEIRNKPPPRIDMSLRPKFRRNSKESSTLRKGLVLPNLKRKSIKDYSTFAKSLYKTPKVSPQIQLLQIGPTECGQYLP